MIPDLAPISSKFVLRSATIGSRRRLVYVPYQYQEQPVLTDEAGFARDETRRDATS